MNPIVIKHVKVGDLPEAWRTSLPADAEARVTIRIEEEAAPGIAQPERPDDPLFGMWSDRQDTADVEGYLRKVRAPRFPRAG